MADKVDVWMPFFVKDYMAATTDLSIEEHGAYTMLLFSMWQAGGSLPVDHERLSRLCRMSRKRWDMTWALLARFFAVSADGLTFTQRRLASEMEKAQARRAKAAESGRRSGEARRERTLNDRSTDVQPPFELTMNDRSTNAERTLNSASASASSPEEKREKKEKKPDSAHARALADFSRLWESVRGASYAPTPADKSHLGALLRSIPADQVPELPKAFAAYLADADPFVAKQGHSLRFFCSAGGFNKYRGRLPAASIRIGHARIDGPKDYGTGDQEL